MIAQRGILINSVDNALNEIAWMRCRESYPANPGDLARIRK